MKQKLTIILMLAFCFISQMSAQTLNTYYPSEKAYEDAKTNGLKIQSKNGKYGFVNAKEKFIIKPIFDEVTKFQSQLSMVKYNGKWGVIDLHGRTVIEPKYTTKPQCLKYNGQDVTQCIILQNNNDSKSVGVISNIDGEYIVIDMKKHIHLNKQDIFITDTISPIKTTFIHQDSDNNESSNLFNNSLDTDGDGVPNHEDDCPATAGTIECKGCPDTDGDGVPDSEDDCPTIAGSIEWRGCLSCQEKTNFIAYKKPNTISGPAYIIDNEGRLIIIDNLIDIIDTDIIILSNGYTISALNKKTGIITVIPKQYSSIYRSMLFTTTKNGVIFRADNYSSYGLLLYYDYSTNNFVSTIEYDIYEDTLGNLTYIYCGDHEGYRILNSSNNKTIGDGIRRIEKYKDGKLHTICNSNTFGSNSTWDKNNFDDNYNYILLTHSNSSDIKTLIKRDGSIIYSGKSIEIISKYIIYHEESRGYGILDMNGKNLLPAIVKRQDIVIENDSYFICAELYNSPEYYRNRDKENPTIIFASSDGWYETVSISEENKIRNMFDNLLQNKKLDTINITPMYSTIPPSYKPTLNYCYTPSSWFEEEIIDGITYTQPISMFFYNNKYDKKRYEECIEQKNGRYTKDLDIFDIYIIRRINEDGKFYLKYKESAFELNELLLDSWFYCDKILPNHLAILSNEKILFSFGVDYVWKNLIHTINNSTIFLFDPQNPQNVKKIESKQHAGYKNIRIAEDGFYLFNSSFIAKYNNNGECIWDFGFKEEEYFTDFDMNDKYVIITGYNTIEKYYAKPNPMTVLLNKQTGEIVKRSVESYMTDGNINHYWTNVALFKNGYALQRIRNVNQYKKVIEATKVIKFQE